MLNSFMNSWWLSENLLHNVVLQTTWTEIFNLIRHSVRSQLLFFNFMHMLFCKSLSSLAKMFQISSFRSSNLRVFSLISSIVLSIAFVAFCFSSSKLRMVSSFQLVIFTIIWSKCSSISVWTSLTLSDNNVF